MPEPDLYPGQPEPCVAVHPIRQGLWCTRVEGHEGDHSVTAPGGGVVHWTASVPGFASAEEAMRATKSDECSQAEEPVGWRIMRAFLNGYSEGLKRGLDGRFDHGR